MYNIIIQEVIDKNKIFVPKKNLIKKWCKATLNNQIPSAEVIVRIVSKQEITDLNTTFRHKKSATNVLAFPFSIPKDIPLDIPILGDIVICAEIVNDEAQTQGKIKEAHWAHMIIHGLLHLLGYDHKKDREAEKMEAFEINILEQLGFANPY